MVKYNERNPTHTETSDTGLRLLQIHSLTLDLNLFSVHQMRYFSFLTESIVLPVGDMKQAETQCPKTKQYGKYLVHKYSSEAQKYTSKVK